MHPSPQRCLMRLAAVPCCACGKLPFPPQLQALRGAAAAARRDEGWGGDVLGSKVAAFEGGGLNHVPGGSLQDYVVFTACLETC